MSDSKSSKIAAEVVIDPTPEQLRQMSMFIEKWQTTKGLVVGAFAEKDGAYKIGFRQVPPELGKQIFKIVDDFYAENGGQTDVS